MKKALWHLFGMGVFAVIALSVALYISEHEYIEPIICVSIATIGVISLQYLIFTGKINDKNGREVRLEKREHDVLQREQDVHRREASAYHIEEELHRLKVDLINIGKQHGIRIIENRDGKLAPLSRSQPQSTPSAPPPPILPPPNEQEDKLNDKQQFIFDRMDNTNESMFITGGAGTGKSYLLRYFMNHAKKRSVTIVVAPTGIAALNIGGTTIHSFFQFPPDVLDKKTLSYAIEPLLYNDGYVKKLQNIGVLIIDEISMVRADVLNAIDVILRIVNRAVGQPFGGKQVIMCGDPFQLPPIVDDKKVGGFLESEFGGYFFFDAHVFRENSIVCHELTDVFRQRDIDFINILNKIRVGGWSQADVNTLNTKCNTKPTLGRPCATLVPRKKQAQDKNAEELGKLKSKIFRYNASIIGNFKPEEYPTDEPLVLKVGAVVVMLKNTPPTYVNGTMGIISDLADDFIVVNINGKDYHIDKKTWDKKEYFWDSQTKIFRQEVAAAFTQYPIKLAWALTIHKSQGQTYDEVSVDLGEKGAFETGQTYVALSRCKSMDTLHILRPIKRTDITANRRIQEFMPGTQSHQAQSSPLPTGSRLLGRIEGWIPSKYAK